MTRRFIFDDQIFKGLALRAPFVKLVGMALRWRLRFATCASRCTLPAPADFSSLPI